MGALVWKPAELISKYYEPLSSKDTDIIIWELLIVYTNPLHCISLWPGCFFIMCRSLLQRCI